MKAIERFISNQICDGFSKEEVNEYLNKCSSILKKQGTGYPFSSDKDVAEKIAFEWDIKKSDAAEIVAELRAGNGTEEDM